MTAMTYERDELRQLVRDERKRRGWNQQALADQASVSKRTIWAFEKGHTWPQDDNLSKILEAVGLQSANLIGSMATDGHRADAIAADAAVRERTIESWPLHIRVFLDQMGAFLATKSEEEQLAYIRERTIRDFLESRQP